VHFGLGPDSAVKELRVEWPSGAIQTLRDVPADRIITVREDEANIPTDSPPARTP
jgi:hypothetical protein